MAARALGVPRHLRAPVLAILYSRRGDDKQAVECYLQACRQNPQFVHRGNLDPEISSLIKKYQTTLSPLIDAL